MPTPLKVMTKPHPEFKDKKCILVETGAKFYGFFGEARYFMEVSEGYKHPGCLSKFREAEGAPFAKALREEGTLPHIETHASIKEYFGHTDNFFA